ncbi:DUF262 domain-containing protein [Methylobacter psychrophilus]|uniref:DUF262 domain-containing protein n=1 Tax=Methylobacter psychrophilus TaxID=96941 RepID=UPI0021D4EE4C|nr:DUF262 domain-containing protein [Methylobacter psychrophilus]
MSYDSTTIANVLGKLNKSYFLPDIQRPFVWDTDQITRLFDSLMQNYPISSFLFWDVNEKNTEEREIYKFIIDFRCGENQDEKIDLLKNDNITLVMDGQQRLTSLMIGLIGSYSDRPKNQRKNPNGPIKKALYLDLLKDPSAEMEDDDNPKQTRYGFDFFETPPSRYSSTKFWFKVSDILDCNKDTYRKRRHALVEQAGLLSKEQLDVFETNFEKLYDVICQDKSISYYTETSPSYDKVVEIFIRANDGGTKLSKSDILMSMLTKNWTTNARDEINNLVLYLNSELESKNDVNRDFILRTSLVFCLKTDFSLKTQNFTQKNIKLIEANWLNIKNALELSFRTVNFFGIDKRNLTSVNAIMVIAYYFYGLPNLDHAKKMAIDPENQKLIRQWLGSALLNGIFTGQAANTIGMAKRVIDDEIGSSNYFPAKSLVTKMTLRGRLVLEYDNVAIGKFMDISYSKKLGFVALSTLYDNNNWANDHYQKVSLFPKKLFDNEKLLSLGVSENEIDLHISRMPNLLLLSRDEIIEKEEMDFSIWIQSRNDNFFDQHLLPKDMALYRPEKFLGFIKHREERIENRLKSLF